MNSSPATSLAASSMPQLTQMQTDDNLPVLEDSVLSLPSDALDYLKSHVPSPAAVQTFQKQAGASTLPLPTVLRSELQSCGKSEFLACCNKIGEYLEQTINLCSSLPVVPKTVIAGIEVIRETCNKRKRDIFEGKPIPPEDYIIIKESDDEEICDDNLSPRKGLSPPKAPSKKMRLSAITLNPSPADSSSTSLNTLSSGDRSFLSDNSLSLTSGGPQSSFEDAVREDGEIVEDVNQVDQSLATGLETPAQADVSNPGPTFPAPPAPKITLCQNVNTQDLTADSNKDIPQDSPITATNNPSGPAPVVSVVKDETCRAEIHEILNTYSQGVLNREKLALGYKTAQTFIERSKQSANSCPASQSTAEPQFSLVIGEQKNNDWVKEISKNLEKLLKPCASEAWFFPEVFDIGNLDSERYNVNKAENIEYHLITLLRLLQKPAKHSLNRWSQCIASAIQLTAQDFSSIPNSLDNLREDDVTSHVRIIETLISSKISGPTEAEGRIRNNISLKPLHALHDLIIDIFTSYAIIRANTASNSSESETGVETGSDSVAASRKQLEKHRRGHNYVPFCFYLIAGVRGLMLAPNNFQLSTGSHSFAFLHVIQHVYQKSPENHLASEPIWKTLSAYINTLFVSTFCSPGVLFKFQRPQIVHLAQVITIYYLNSWQKSFPQKNYQIPRLNSK